MKDETTPQVINELPGILNEGGLLAMEGQRICRCKCGHSMADHDYNAGCGAVNISHFGAGVEDVIECECTQFSAA